MVEGGDLGLEGFRVGGVAREEAGAGGTEKRGRRGECGEESRFVNGAGGQRKKVVGGKVDVVLSRRQGAEGGALAPAVEQGGQLLLQS